eukprot:756418-Hanusia_phi.AAC.2
MVFIDREVKKSKATRAKVRCNRGYLPTAFLSFLQSERERKEMSEPTSRDVQFQGERGEQVRRAVQRGEQEGEQEAQKDKTGLEKLILHSSTSWQRKGATGYQSTATAVLHHHSITF